jgi:glycosyltransferase involved in cell wall biosynthesis
LADVKILFYNHTGKVSGAERVLLMILSRLDSKRFQSVLLCPADGSLEAMAKNASIRTVVSQPLQARFTRRPDQLIQYLSSLVRIVGEARVHIRREAPDVIHANSVRAGLVMSAATVGLRMPVIWHVHDLLPRHPFSSLIRLFAALSARNRIVAVSEAVARRFRGRILRPLSRRVPVVTIHNGIELEKFDPQCANRDEIRKSLGLDCDALLIGTVGQLTPRKGQLELIRAFDDVSKDFPIARLVIVGDAIFNRDGEYRDLLHREAQRLGLSDRIKFLGARDDVAALTQAFDLSVINSSAEPFGLTVVEAMAVKTPVLATAVDGICEILTHGETGWLVASRDHGQLVSSLRTLMGNPHLRAALSKRAFAEVHRRFSADRLVNQVETVFSKTSKRQELAADLHRFATSRT